MSSHVHVCVYECVMTARGRNSIQLIGKAGYISRKATVSPPWCQNPPHRLLPFQCVFLASVTMAARELCNPGEKQVLLEIPVQFNYSSRSKHSLHKVFSSTLYCRIYNKKNSKMIERGTPIRL